MFRKTAIPPIYRSRGEYIFSLVPKLDLRRDDSDEDDDPMETVNHDEVENLVNTFLQEYDLMVETPEGNQLAQDDAVRLITEPEAEQDQPISPSIQMPDENVAGPGPSTSSIQNKIRRKKTHTQKRKASKRGRPKKNRQQLKKNAKISFKWSRTKFCSEVTLPPKQSFGEVYGLEPIDYFQMFFTDEVYEHIISQTNLYSAQRTGKPIGLTKNELLDFISCLLIMGVVKMPASDDYWSTETRYEKVASRMSRNKFKNIRRFIHFQNNELPNNGDKFHKVRPLVELIRREFNKIEPEGRYSVDEMMCPYKGRKAGSLRQYIRNKPTKWGFKFFVLASISGVIYDFHLYCGEGTFNNVPFTPEESLFSFSEKVVISLIKNITNKPLSVVFFDNFFSTPNLMHYLRREYGILSLGVLRQDRTRGAPFLTESEIKKKGRGFFEQVTDEEKKITMVKWFDNKSVIVGSTYKDAEPTITVRRWIHGHSNKSTVPAPALIGEYNKHMGGVDLCDMFIALYRTQLRSWRYHLNIFAQILDMCVCNSWLLYKRDRKNCKMSLKKFRMTLAEELHLYKRTKKGRGSASRSPSPNANILTRTPLPDSVRLDTTGHWPAYTNRGKCRHCKVSQSNVLCFKCKMRLCLRENKNCFAEFHCVNITDL